MNKDILSYRLLKSGCLVCASLLLLSQIVYSEIIPSDRRINWAPGRPGGIPNRTTIYTTLGPSSTAAQINSALSACPSNQVVMLSAGTYSISQTIVVPSFKTLRGAGPGKSILSMSGSGTSAIRLGSENSPNPATSATITGGLTKGSTSITLSSASGISVGTLLMINQLDDAAFVTSTGSSGPCDWCDAGWPNNRNMGQIVEVTSVNGNTVGINAPLYWTYNNSPMANPFTAGCRSGGVEDLTVYANKTGYTANFLLSGSAYCWLKNVEGDFADGDHARLYWSYGCEVRDSYFHDGFNHGPGGTDNCVVLAHKSSACLVENNIFWRMHVSVMLEWGAAGNVVSYNYSTNNYHETWLAWMINDICFHGAHPAFNLFEGNMGIQFRPDSTWGSSSHSTLLRNWFAGADYYAPPMSARGAIQWGSGSWENANNYAVSIDYLSPSNNLVGNIAGSPWLAANGGTYLRVAPAANGRACYRFGYNSDSDAAVGPAVFASAVFHGNYDWVTAVLHWDTLISDQTIPNSYYLSGKPAWFGAGQWPPINPANLSTLSVTNLPAGYRFLYGTNPPSGGPVNLAPSAVASANPKLGTAPLNVTFSSAGSSDPEGRPLSYSWIFGDGSTSTAANPSHTFSTAGNFIARLTVSDGTNSTTSTNISITATVPGQNLPPVAVASAAVTAGVAPLAVTFSSAGSSDPEGAALTYNWTFGDGATSTAANPSHTYPASGIFAAQLRVSDGTNNTLSSVLTITAANGATGLVAAYGFEEGSGGGVTDGSGRGNNGTISGATWTTAGHSGKALSFGSGAMVTVNDSPSLDLTTGMTLEAWVYPTATGSSWMNLIFKGNPNTGSVLSYVLQGATPPGQVPSLYISPAPSNLLGPSTFALNTWSHVVATYDGASMKLYVNGVLVASQAQTGAMGASTDSLTIGGNAFGGSNWAGRIDEVRIYNRALSASEIQTDMNTPVIGLKPPQGLRVVP